MTQLLDEADVYKLGKTVKQIINTDRFVAGPVIRIMKRISGRPFNTSLVRKLNLRDRGLRVCVEPNTINAQDTDVIKFIGSQEYDVFYYDELKKKKSLEPLDIKLPRRIIQHTMTQIKQSFSMMKDINETVCSGAEIIKRNNFNSTSSNVQSGSEQTFRSREYKLKARVFQRHEGSTDESFPNYEENGDLSDNMETVQRTLKDMELRMSRIESNLDKIVEMMLNKSLNKLKD